MNFTYKGVNSGYPLHRGHVEILYSATKRRENINTATRMDLLVFLQSAMLGFELSCCYRMTFLSNNSVFFSSKLYLFMLIYIHSSFTRLRMRGDLVITFFFQLFELHDRGHQNHALHRFSLRFFIFSLFLGGACVGRDTCALCSEFLGPIFHKCSRESSSIVNLYGTVTYAMDF